MHSVLDSRRSLGVVKDRQVFISTFRVLGSNTHRREQYAKFKDGINPGSMNTGKEKADIKAGQEMPKKPC